MKVSEAVKSRFSVREFQSTLVPRATVEGLLRRASQAPSGGNLQPWHVYVLSGQPLQDFKDMARERGARNPMGEGSEFEIYPPKLKEPYRTRRFRCGEDLYASINVPREDKPARFRQYARNLDAFGAPVLFFFTLDRSMGPSQWAHLGMYMQTLALLAREQGLHTCMQEVWAHWYELVGEFLNIPAEQMLYCGMALGYASEDAPINQWRTERADLSEFADLRGFDD